MYASISTLTTYVSAFPICITPGTCHRDGVEASGKPREGSAGKVRPSVPPRYFAVTSGESELGEIARLSIHNVLMTLVHTGK